MLEDFCTNILKTTYSYLYQDTDTYLWFNVVWKLPDCVSSWGIARHNVSDGVVIAGHYFLESCSHMCGSPPDHLQTKKLLNNIKTISAGRLSSECKKESYQAGCQADSARKLSNHKSPIKDAMCQFNKTAPVLSNFYEIGHSFSRECLGI